MSARLCALALTLTTGCASASDVERRAATVMAATTPGDRGLCPAEPMARAHAEVAFARLASGRGDGLTADRHLVAAERAAAEVVLQRASCPLVGAELPVPTPDAPADRDRDGVPDAVDRCLAEREDKDGWLDQDGCPDPDNDGDGASDVIDQCPDAPEDKDGFEDLDGCPEPGTPEAP